MDQLINSVKLVAVLTERKELRYTPAGLPVFEGKFHFEGDVYEAGAPRHLSFDFTGITFTDNAVALDKVALGSKVAMDGFIAPRSMKTQKLTVHITQFSI